MSERIEIRDGKAYVVTETWLYSQPIRRTGYTLLDINPEQLSPNARADYIGGGFYCAEIGPLRVRRDVRRYNSDPEAVAEIIEETPIPPPRTKSQTRYDGCAGRWERLTRKGWV